MIKSIRKVFLVLSLFAVVQSSAFDKSSCALGVAVSTVQFFLFSLSHEVQAEQNMPVQAGLTALQAGLIYRCGESYGWGALTGAALGYLSGSRMGDVINYMG